MHTMDPRDVEAIAALARLEGDEEKLRTFARQLDEILSYMDTLNRLDTTGVEPLYSPLRHAAPFREDEPVQEYSREDLLRNAPEDDGQYFMVPKVF